MTSFKVKIKWGKETYTDVELDTSEAPEVFRAQVFALTGVQPSRQKILLKGATLKPDSWDGAKLKNGALVVVMGSRDEDALQEPPQTTQFLEDMSEGETNAALDMPVGIKNLGNTCYLNAVVQCIKTVPELHQAIVNFDTPAAEGAERSSGNAMLLNTIKATYETMDRGNTALPLLMVEIFRVTFPRFAEQASQGGYMQQDASECWTELMHLLQDSLPPRQPNDTLQRFRSSLVAQYMSGEMSCEWKCDEEGGDPSTTSDALFHQLSCHISTDVKYLQTGILARLTEKITKHSKKLDRDAMFTKKSQITRLPSYLTIDMVRFYYKEKEAVNAKILKDVKFPMVLDVMDLCSPQLQKRLEPYREHFKDMDDRDKEEARARKTGKPLKDKPKVKSVPHHFQDDVGSCNSGYYSLQAVLTHQGRTSSSGHYVAWVRFRDGHWLKCDDDEMSAVTVDEILKLSGGGDWHCAYILLYGPRPLTVLEDLVIKDYVEQKDEKKEVASTTAAAAGGAEEEMES